MTLNISQGAYLLFSLILLALTVPAIQLDWQGVGNMTESNMTQIKTLVAQNPVPPDDSLPGFDSAAQNISTHLNNLWDPAWNVIIYSFSSNVDAIFYGYAFRGHWMWFNGLPNPGNSALFMTYIIWKDYNCIEWRTLNSTLTGFTSDEYRVIDNTKNSITADQITNDLWITVYNYVLAI